MMVGILYSYSQDSTNTLYCVAKMDGRMILTTNGRTQNTDVTLKDGSLLRINGSLLKKDGTKVSLKEDQCIDLDGNISWRKKEE